MKDARVYVCGRSVHLVDGVRPHGQIDLVCMYLLCVCVGIWGHILAF